MWPLEANTLTEGISEQCTSPMVLDTIYPSVDWKNIYKILVKVPKYLKLTNEKAYLIIKLWVPA